MSLKDSITKTVLICGETLSSNLGDQVIGDCLAYLLRERPTPVEVKKFDISLRGFGAASIKGTASPFLQRLKTFHRRLYARSDHYRSCINRLTHYKNQKAYIWKITQALIDVDIVIIGGGQLFQDNSLSFPLKMDLIVSICRKQGIPVVFFSVGVGEKWSSRGWEICEKMLSSDAVMRIYCRDERSSEILKARLIRDAGKVFTTFDVALLTKFAYSASKSKTGTVGIGTISPLSVSTVDAGYPFGRYDWARKFWRDLCVLLLERGEVLELFTNGSEQDFLFATEIYNSIPDKFRLSSCISLAPRPMSSIDLVQGISRYERIIAARLHANIVAESLGIPWIGFGWDKKVPAFALTIEKQINVIHVPLSADAVFDHYLACLSGPQRESREEVSVASLRRCIDEVFRLHWSKTGGDDAS